MAGNKKIVSRPLDIQELESKAMMYERWARSDDHPAWKELHAAKAKRIRNMLKFMEKAGWAKRNSRQNVAVNKYSIEKR